MATRLILLCHAATPSMRAGGFPVAGEAPDGAALARLNRIAAPRHDSACASPAAAARQTANALGIAASPEERLRDLDHGRWTGLPFTQVAADEPEAFAAWLADPAAGAPGGESMAQARARVGGWLSEQTARDGTVLAITHPMIVRATLAAVLALPAEGVMRFDIAPLSMAILSHNRGWRLQALGSGLSPAPAP